MLSQLQVLSRIAQEFMESRASSESLTPAILPNWSERQFSCFNSPIVRCARSEYR
jgi:hypothetical protein